MPAVDQPDESIPENSPVNLLAHADNIPADADDIDQRGLLNPSEPDVTGDESADNVEYYTYNPDTMDPKKVRQELELQQMMQYPDEML